MLLMLAMTVAAPDCVPARWHSADPRTIALIRQTPINCVLIEREHWSAEFNAAAAKGGIAALGVIRPDQDLASLAEKLRGAGLEGAVLEGVFPPETAAALRDSKITVIEMGPRARMKFSGPGEITATNQGLWPGINTTEEEGAHAAPSGGPWIDTNSGFLRFARLLPWFRWPATSRRSATRRWPGPAGWWRSIRISKRVCSRRRRAQSPTGNVSANICTSMRNTSPGGICGRIRSSP
jgi:hypothetical protein